MTAVQLYISGTYKTNVDMHIQWATRVTEATYMGGEQDVQDIH